VHNYTRQIFDTLTKKEKRAFIDRMIDSTLDLNEKEIQIATTEQRKRYFDLKFHTRRIINPHELKFLDFDQILHFLQKNNNMIELYILKYLTEKQRVIVIKKVANSKFPLNGDEVQQLKSSERKIYAKERMESDWGYLMRVFTVKYLDVEDQKKYIDMSVSQGCSFSKEMVDVLKAPARKYYQEKIQINESIQSLIKKSVLSKLI
jgi:hypothetical protein